MVENTGLGNQILLSKIDELRELGISSEIPLPQLVVVGDQSSGKSSVLESLTGFGLPRDTGLCTRYATQITCRRDSLKSVSISIIAGPNADAERKECLQSFRRTVDDISGDDFLQIYEEANKTMGIRPAGVEEDDQDNLTTFSEDILKVEMSGPDQGHLTVIDVPGIFRTTTPGLTTEDDIRWVYAMVQEYMANPRTIILAVIPCTADPATQEILKLASHADPEGLRTMGVLTKPDLLAENNTKRVIVDLVQGKKQDLRLGYYLVKNRNADDTTSSLQERDRSETSFFKAEPWSKLTSTGRVGIAALKKRVTALLMEVTNREFPHVRATIASKLKSNREELLRMGEARGDAASQRHFLTVLASDFQDTAKDALTARYNNHSVFKNNHETRLITQIVRLNEAFSNLIATRGQVWLFEGEDMPPLTPQAKHRNNKTTPAPSSRPNPITVDFEIPSDEASELDDIIVPDRYECPVPCSDPIMDHIKVVFNNNRGSEIGTFSGGILETAFTEQTMKWENITLSHVSDAILLVHHFIGNLLRLCIPEQAVRTQVWEHLLLDELRVAYKKAMDHARFLLEAERDNTLVTLNHYFSDNLDKARNNRKEREFLDLADGDSHFGEHVVHLDKFKNYNKQKANAEQALEDIHDALKSYYKVARKRFVDNIYQQSIYLFLLHGRRSPLRIFCPSKIAELSESELELIAGEDPHSQETRQHLIEETKKLEAGMRIMRT